jgi:hypothetical protein
VARKAARNLVERDGLMRMRALSVATLLIALWPIGLFAADQDKRCTHYGRGNDSCGKLARNFEMDAAGKPSGLFWQSKRAASAASPACQREHLLDFSDGAYSMPCARNRSLGHSPPYRSPVTLRTLYALSSPENSMTTSSGETTLAHSALAYSIALRFSARSPQASCPRAARFLWNGRRCMLPAQKDILSGKS